MSEIELAVSAIFNSYYYNREISYMIKLCREVLDRMNQSKNINRTYDGDIIYGFLVLRYGNYGTSPRSGWIEGGYLDDITNCINVLIEEYALIEEEENEDT